MEQELLGYLNQIPGIPDERKDLNNLVNLKWLYKELFDREKRRKSDANGPRAMQIIILLASQMGV